MAEKKPAKKEAPKAPVDHYKEALTFIHMAEEVLLWDFKIKYYKTALEHLGKVTEEHEDREELKASVQTKLSRTQAEAIIALYRKGLDEKKNAGSPDDFDRAAETLRAAADLLKSEEPDESLLADDMKKDLEECRTAAQKAEEAAGESRKHYASANVVKIVVIAAIILALAGALLCVRSATFMLCIGKVQEFSGNTQEAQSTYYKEYTKTGSKEALKLYRESLLADAEKYAANGNYADAITAMKGLQDIDDHEIDDLIAETELRAISEAAPGDQVYFGKADWYLAESDGSTAVLIRKSGLVVDCFQQDAQENGGTWADSWLREYLNDTYLNRDFSEDEQQYMITAEVVTDDNPVYGTDGGPATKDKVYLLSVDELEKYTDLINKTTEHLWWLRTPGAEEGTMCVVDVDKTVLVYGYAEDYSGFRGKPVIQVDLSSLQKEEEN